MIRHNFHINFAFKKESKQHKKNDVLLVDKNNLKEVADYIEQNKDHYRGSKLEQSVKKLLAETELIEDAIIETDHDDI